MSDELGSGQTVGFESNWLPIWLFLAANSRVDFFCQLETFVLKIKDLQDSMKLTNYSSKDPSISQSFIVQVFLVKIWIPDKLCRTRQPFCWWQPLDTGHPCLSYLGAFQSIWNVILWKKKTLFILLPSLQLFVDALCIVESFHGEEYAAAFQTVWQNLEINF